ncbi:S8 family peptidase [Chishuiella sp.]|uniref:S8 family peptidase n=1 Tax=Chishuiella sp. TaxID=1969467 RepID=UPI0028AD62AA|nr:S8 family peptidase [Chishuiella sp.]
MIRNLQKLTNLKVIKSNSLPILGTLLFLSGTYLSAQYKIDPRFENLLKERKNNVLKKTSNSLTNDEVLPITSLISPNGTVKEYYQAIIYTKDPEQLKKDGYLVQSVSEDFVTALLSENDFNRLRDNQYISTVKYPQIDYLNNQSNVIESGATLLQNGVLNGTNYTGKDILVGIYDTGIDFTHPDFIDPITKQSRILSIWDQTLTPIAGENSPNLYETANRGVEYTQAHINDEIDGTPTGYIREKDGHGHGTHVAGTAAGNGSALEGATHKGMAPEATLVIVKGGDGGFPTTNTIEALDYFKKVADEQGKPIVVNMSIGGQASPHDGKSAHEIKVNDFTTSGSGRVVVISAGNEGSENIHQRINLAPNEKKSIQIQIGENNLDYTSSLFSFLAFTKGDKNTSAINVKLTAPTGDVFTQNAGSGGTYYLKNKTGDEYQELNIYNYVDSSSGKRFIQLVAQRLDLTDTEGIYDLEIENVSNNNITLDGWLYATNYNLADIYFPEGDNNYTIGSPGTADEAITVANYVGNVAFAVNSDIPDNNGTYSGNTQTETLNSSSSKGPRADEVRKPDIAAGGTFVISAKTKDNTDPYIIDGKYYSQMTGTSMSSPAVAGATALLLQANKQLTAKDVKQRLIENVNKDNFTTDNYTNEFGYGKLNIYKAVSAEVNKLNNNTSCPISVNYTLANDVLAYKWGFSTATNPVNNGTNNVNYSTSHVGVKLIATATGKLGNITFLLGNYNSNTTETIPLIIDIRKVNNEGKPGDLIATKTIKNVKTLEQSGWNNLNFADENINVVSGQELFVVLKTTNTNLVLGSDNINVSQKTYLSRDNGTTFTVNNQYNAKVRALVYENLPAVKQLATTSKEATQSVELGYNHFINGCELITRVESNGVIPISGNTTAKVWIDSEAKNFVQRRIEINASNNNSTSTGKVTLYYTQNDFDIYNKNSTVKLPTSPTDDTNKDNLIIYYYAGKSKDNTGLSSSYENTPISTKLEASNVIWNDTYKYWEITVDAVGFGGYLLSTDSTLSNIDNTLNQLTVYPNPVINDLSINLPSNINNAQINIINITGQTVLKTDVKQNYNKINLSNLPKGVYIIEIKTTSGTLTKKIIKN